MSVKESTADGNCHHLKNDVKKRNRDNRLNHESSQHNRLNSDSVM